MQGAGSLFKDGNKQDFPGAVERTSEVVASKKITFTLKALDWGLTIKDVNDKVIEDGDEVDDGSLYEPPEMTWKKQPHDTTAVYFVMWEGNNDEIRWLAKAKSKTALSSEGAEQIEPYNGPPRETRGATTYYFRILAVDKSFSMPNDHSKLKTLGENEGVVASKTITFTQPAYKAEGFTAVATWEELKEAITGTGNCKGCTIRLTKDITMRQWGYEGTLGPLLAKFDGGGYTIKSPPTETGNNAHTATGLFTRIEKEASVKNLTFKNLLTIVVVSRNTHDDIGTLAGINLGTIENVTITGDRTRVWTWIKIDDDKSMGGLVGVNKGTIKNCKIEAMTVTYNASASNVGGFVGLNSGTIENSFVKKLATNGYKDRYEREELAKKDKATNIGGFVGKNEGGTITKAYAKGKSGEQVVGKTSVGGFVGWQAGGKISQSFTDLAVRVGDDNNTYDFAGGFVGSLNGGGTIENCYATGDVSGEPFDSKGGSSMGGFVGALLEVGSTIRNTYATGNISRGRNGQWGPFIAYYRKPTELTVEASYYLEREIPATQNPQEAGRFTSGTDPVLKGYKTTDLTGTDKFSGWDFSGIWKWVDGQWPTLKQ